MAGGEMNPVSWTELFSSLGADDIFEAIRDAIAVAAHNHPHELEQRRDSILQMLDAAAVDESAPFSEKTDDGTKNQLAGDENGSASSEEAFPPLSEHAKINGLLVGGEDGRPCSDQAVLESLRALKGVRMTFETLEATKIGRAVSGLRKHESEQVRELAHDLYKGWNALADEHFGGNRTSPTSTNTASAAAAAHVKANTAAPNPSYPNQETPAASRETPKVVERVSVCKRMEASMNVIDEARLATAKRKLHDGYGKAATARKQRRIQVISEPEKTRQRPVVRRHCMVRHHTAAVAGRRVPAP